MRNEKIIYGDNVMKKFTKEHEWIKVEGEVGIVGISDYAQKQLGDVVYVSLSKEIDDEISKGDDVAEIESVKSVSQVYAPVDGKLVEFNIIFEDESKSGIINEDPYQEGWIFKLSISDTDQLEPLMDEKEYEEYISKLTS